MGNPHRGANSVTSSPTVKVPWPARVAMLKMQQKQPGQTVNRATTTRIIILVFLDTLSSLQLTE
jgi:hypothetical protein